MTDKNNISQQVNPKLKRECSVVELTQPPSFPTDPNELPLPARQWKTTQRRLSFSIEDLSTPARKEQVIEDSMLSPIRHGFPELKMPDRQFIKLLDIEQSKTPNSGVQAMFSSTQDASRTNRWMQLHQADEGVLHKSGSLQTENGIFFWDIGRSNLIFIWYKLLIVCTFGYEAMKVPLYATDTPLQLVFNLAMLGFWTTAFILGVFIYPKNKKHMIYGLLCFQCRILIAQFPRQLHSKAAADLDLSEDEANYIETRRIIVMYFLFSMVIYNTTFCVILLTSRKKRILFGLFTLVLSLLVMVNDLPDRAILQGDALFQVVYTTATMIAYSLTFVWICLRIDQERVRLILEQFQENNQFKRIIDSVEEAMVILQSDGQVSFTNKVARHLFQGPQPIDSTLLDRKLFYPFNYNSSSQQEKAERVEPLSFNDLVSPVYNLPKTQIFTFDEDLANCQSMNQLQKILEKMKKKKDTIGTKQCFDFFIIKVIKLQSKILTPSMSSMSSSSLDETGEKAIQLIDFSEKIFMDNLYTERKYLTYVNATVSHEMRNPLNSINAQIQNWKVELAKLKDFEIPKEKKEEMNEILSSLDESLQICNSSCRLMNFNVEDIMALPALKEGKFQKNYQEVNLRESVEDIKRIQSWTANRKRIKIDIQFKDFPDHRSVRLDEQRFQQVLLNFLSNSLKFMDKPRGRVLLLVQYIPAADSDSSMEMDSGTATSAFIDEADLFYGAANFVGPEVFRLCQHSIPKRPIQQGFRLKIAHTSSDEASSSPRNSQNDLHQCNAARIFSTQAQAKIVLSVLDNGVGIKREDQKKLFKLFGCLQSNRGMNTKGIGLGLVISKMLAEEFGGTTQMFSRYQTGSVFQASFLLPDRPLPEVRESERVVAGPQFDLSELKEAKREDQEAMIKQYVHNYQVQQQEVCKAYVRGETQSYSAKKIMVIDDEPYNCEAISALIKSHQLQDITHRVTSCSSGAEALKILIESFYRTTTACASTKVASMEIGQPQVWNPGLSLNVIESALEEASRAKNPQESQRIFRENLNPEGHEHASHFSLILTDCSMPFMDGYQCSQFARQLFKAFKIREEPKIVAITGHIEFEYQLRAYLSGMEQVYSKPITHSEIGRILMENGFRIKVPKG